MCKVCEEEYVKLVGWSLEDYQAIFCKSVDTSTKIPPLLAPQLLKRPKERFDRQQFGIMLCQLRESRNLTQAEAARRVGIDRKAWNSMECGKRLPRLDTAAVIAEAFDKSIEDLFKV